MTTNVTLPPDQERRALEPILALLREGRVEAADAACQQLLAVRADCSEAWRLASRIHQRQGRFDQMLDAAQRAATLAPDSLDAQLQSIECQIYCGRTGEALAALERLEAVHAGQPRALLAIAEYYMHGNRHLAAHRCFAAAARLAPADPAARLSLAASCTTIGQIDQARALLEEAIEQSPRDCDAWVNLANLRTWTPAENHVAQLERMLAELREPAAQTALCYALHKELEDLGQPARAFEFLQRGAAARRRAMRYRVERDLAVMAEIGTVFPGPVTRPRDAAPTGTGAIFVMGLPRTGTTLVDRILSSHPAVESLGELRDFTFAVLRHAGPGESGQIPLVRRSAAIDFTALGHAYLEAVKAYRNPAVPGFVDKTPANALYAGLISRALPGARLVLLRRHPLDACYAMYKTLFEAGYPFSYDLEDLGRYYAGWHRLMEHWRRVIPGHFLELDYESLVLDQEAGTRRLLEHCDLEWDARCLQFHLNPAPAATASAAQVRRPLYRSSLGRWREHAAALEPTARILRAAGIACD